MSMNSRKKKALGILSTLLLPMNSASYVPHNETTSVYSNFKANDLSNTAEIFPPSSEPMPPSPTDTDTPTPTDSPSPTDTPSPTDQHPLILSNYTDDWSNISSVPMPSTYTNDLSDRLSTVQQDKQGHELTFDNQNKKEEFIENLKNGIIKATANLLNSKRVEIVEDFLYHPSLTMQSKEFYKKKIKQLHFYDQLENRIIKDLIEYYPLNKKDDAFKLFIENMHNINKDRLNFFENLIDIINRSETLSTNRRKTQMKLFSLDLIKLLKNHHFYACNFMFIQLVEILEISYDFKK